MDGGTSSGGCERAVVGQGDVARRSFSRTTRPLEADSGWDERDVLGPGSKPRHGGGLVGIALRGRALLRWSDGGCPRRPSEGWSAPKRDREQGDADAQQECEPSACTARDAHAPHAHVCHGFDRTPVSTDRQGVRSARSIPSRSPNDPLGKAASNPLTRKSSW